MPLDPYPRSKTVAERAAWDFVAAEGGGLQLATVNPVLVLGPLLALETSTSVEVVRWLVDGALPGLPRLALAVVDVRDVADLHVLAMERDEAAGLRFLAAADGVLTLREMALTLRAALGERGRRVPTRELPDWLVRLGGRFDDGVRQIVPELGTPRSAGSARARDLLGWTSRSPQDTVVETARSLLDLRAR